MKEEFLHFIWQNQYVQPSLFTAEGLPIVVKNKGVLNSFNGPDFSNAQIEIGGQLWAGNVEIHTKSSDWDLHKHQLDENYNNVILHVVWVFDKEISTLSGHKPNTLVLGQYAQPAIISRLQDFSLSSAYPCENKISEVDSFIINSYIDRLIVERFEVRNKRIQGDYIEEGYDLNESFYRLMALAFGQKINQMGFDMLSKSLSIKVLSKHVGDIIAIESMVFGVAGFLEKDLEVDHYIRLKQSFEHLKNKYNLKPIPFSIWHRGGLRPANFPAVRLAQFSALINKSTRFFNLLEFTPNYTELKDLLLCSPSPFWLTHYGFEKESPQREKKLSAQFVNHLIINAFLPFYFYFKRRSGGASIDMVQSILQQLPPEKNSALSDIERMGLPNKNALHSQAFYHLFRNYCSEKKCLNCRIGHKVLSN
tara:strand:- start:9345 stop:10607 length:1263 start_codon:yes stop_codon:yes gene_type:complete